jgi:hypothetical protein
MDDLEKLREETVKEMARALSKDGSDPSRADEVFTAAEILADDGMDPETAITMALALGRGLDPPTSAAKHIVNLRAQLK